MARWLSGWPAVGALAAAMAAEGWDLSLAGGRGLWRATFHVSGREHSPAGAVHSPLATSPWRAVHLAAWRALAPGAPAPGP
ncbi:MAG: hypothetical protein HY294_08555 [Candidatus Rokubacteria bacterium]|nr:hypothetical protein [Candidatus Rokubacteria bacterium]MBI3826033.1 hypothetical protein [Candidatus Rokubacteria bacterium]